MHQPINLVLQPLSQRCLTKDSIWISKV